jgi:hypothetical protein
MEKAWSVVQSLGSDDMAHLQALVSIARRLAHLGWEKWLRRLTPMLLEAIRGFAQRSVIHISADSRRIGTHLTLEDRLYREILRVKVSSATLDLIPSSVKAKSVPHYCELVNQRPTFRDMGFWRFRVAEDLPFLELLPQAELYECFRKTLKMQSKGSRQELLDDMEPYGPLLYRLGGMEAVLETRKGIGDVCRWWP